MKIQLNYVKRIKGIESLLRTVRKGIIYFIWAFILWVPVTFFNTYFLKWIDSKDIQTTLAIAFLGDFSIVPFIVAIAMLIDMAMAPTQNKVTNLIKRVLVIFSSVAALQYEVTVADILHGSMTMAAYFTKASINLFLGINFIFSVLIVVFIVYLFGVLSKWLKVNTKIAIPMTAACITAVATLIAAVFKLL